VSVVVVDDHLLRDILTDQATPELVAQISDAEVYTTNLWYLRLCRSVAASAGGRLTGALDASQRRALGRELIVIPSDIGIVPFADVAWQMAERHADSASSTRALSTLSCEALVAADQLSAQICVWRGDDGPNLRAACQERDVPYRTIG
jgi:hypothetical protein